MNLFDISPDQFVYENIPLFKTKHNFFKNFSVVIESNCFDHEIRKVRSFSAFKIFFSNCENDRGIKLITKLRVSLSYLREHKFNHSFQDNLNPICSCSFDVELAFHDVLHYPMYNGERHTLQSTIKNVDCRLLDVTKTVLIKRLLFGNCSADARTTHFFLLNVLNSFCIMCLYVIACFYLL